MNGFSLVADGSNQFSTSTQVAGKCFAADYAAPSPSEMTDAVSDMEKVNSKSTGFPSFAR